MTTSDRDAPGADNRTPPRPGGRAPDPVPGELRRGLARLGPLPVLSSSVRRVIALADDPDADAADIVAAVQRDEALCANLLRAANAAERGRSSRASTVTQAVTVVGRARLRSVAMEAATYGLLERSPAIGPGLRAELHSHAVAVAGLAAALAERSGDDADAAHLAGLLHDIGKVVLPMAFGEARLAAALDGAAWGAERAERERAHLGLDHAAAGAALAEAWDLPPAVVTAIRRHHDAGAGGVTGCVQAANELTQVLAGRRTAPDLLMEALGALGIDVETLGELVDVAAGGSQDPAATHERIRELRRRADEDHLTGIASRRRWTERVTAAAGTADAGAVLLIDVDDFKGVNDRHGHLVGDAVLRAIGELIGARGLAGRLGGDEFGLWLDRDGGAALAVADELCAAVAAATPSVTGGWPVGVSIGVATVPEDGRDLTRLLGRADEALYRSKRSGRGRAGAAVGAGPPGPAPGDRPVVTAGAALHAIFEGHLATVAVERRACDPAEGQRAAVAASEAIRRLCQEPALVELALRHLVAPALLAHGFETLALAAVTACRLGLDDQALEALVVAGLLADVGMGRLPSALAAKPALLTPEERRRLEVHPRLGADILEPVARTWPLAPAVALQHHERWDGEGYPAGLSGREILVEAQVIALCHRYLAALEPRPHRPGLPPHEAFELMLTLSDRLVSREVVEAFTGAIALYPDGCLVRLSGGSGGQVVRGGHPTRPHVRILWDRAGAPVAAPGILRLAEAPTVFVEAIGGRPVDPPEPAGRGAGT